ncbi:hypothetical protein C8Q77DRAFT_1162107 [Trametes polyzona]|nr:hypothetical protein C8Q77DRAFT_1162107 [Trametes polyzona]
MADMHIPTIIVTPALPSRNSLSSEMRVILDSIVGPAATPRRTTDPYESDEESRQCDSPHAAYEPWEPESPHARFHDMPAAAENPFRLDLDFENARFSVGAVVSALEATCRAVSGYEAAPGGSPVTSDTDGHVSSRTRGRGRTAPEPLEYGGEGEYVLPVDDSTRPSANTAGAGIEEGADGEGAPVVARAVRRPSRFAGIGNPTWRHAMYISTLVWPSEASDARKARRRSDASSSFEVARAQHSKTRRACPWWLIQNPVRLFKMGGAQMRRARRD